MMRSAKMFVPKAVLAVLCAALVGCGGGANETPLDPGDSEPWFREATAEARLSTALHPGYGHSWGDIDGDGLADVWMINHMHDPTIYRNNGDGTFEDITALAWRGPTSDYHGGSWADFDNDGDQDFSVLAGGDGGTECNEKPFYVNQRSVMQNEAAIRNLDDQCGRGRTPLWLDWNNDGRLDLYLVNGERPRDLLSPSRLMLQNADGTFEELVEMQTQSSAFMAQFAYLNGHVHVLTSSGAPYPAAFQRLGDPTQLPFLVPDQPNGQLPNNVQDIAVGDFDGDLQDDLFIVRTDPPGKSYRIRADGTLDVLVKNLELDPGVIIEIPSAGTLIFKFWSVNWKPGEIRLGQSAVAANAPRLEGDYLGELLVWNELTINVLDADLQGIPAADQRQDRGIYIGRDTDGRLAIHATGDSSETLQFDLKADGGSIGGVEAVGFEFRTTLARRPNFLFFSNGRFEDRKKDWGMDMSLPCPSVVAGDFDNDMDLDLFMACTGPINHEPNRLFENKGGYFQEVSNGGGGAVSWSEEPGGIATAVDYNEDGYLDVLVVEGCEVCGPPLRFGHRTLLRNVRSGNHWIQLNLVGCQSNRDGIGARVVAQAGGKRQMRMAGGGMHKAAQDQRRIHFGMAKNSQVDELRVEWPSGNVTVMNGLTVDRIYEIEEDPGCVRP